MIGRYAAVVNPEETLGLQAFVAPYHRPMTHDTQATPADIARIERVALQRMLMMRELWHGAATAARCGHTEYARILVDMAMREHQQLAGGVTE